LKKGGAGGHADRDREIDKRFYRLYGLTMDEIAMVER
jgi:hypothetical protein